MSCVAIRIIQITLLFVMSTTWVAANSAEDTPIEGPYTPADLKVITSDYQTYMDKKVGVYGFLLVDRSVKIAPTIEEFLSFSEENLLLEKADANEYQSLDGCFVYVAGRISAGMYDDSKVVLKDVVAVVRTGAAFVRATKRNDYEKPIKCEIEALTESMLK